LSSVQSHLLSHNEQEAMSAAELQTKISQLLRSNPDIAEAVSSVNYYYDFDMI